MTGANKKALAPTTALRARPTLAPAQDRLGNCMAESHPKYKRILLKLSGEALMGGRRTGIDAETLAGIADEIVAVHKSGVEIAIVIGGGNIFRGVTAATEGIDRVTGDHTGMLATVINGLALLDALERRGA